MRRTPTRRTPTRLTPMLLALSRPLSPTPHTPRVTKVRLSTWLDGRGDVSASMILMPYTVAFILVLVLLRLSNPTRPYPHPLPHPLPLPPPYPYPLPLPLPLALVLPLAPGALTWRRWAATAREGMIGVAPPWEIEGDMTARHREI